MRRPLTAGRYLLATTLAAIGSFALVWAWTAAFPLAYLDPEYPYWRAKQALLRRCDLGELIVVGDSRAAADVIPDALPVKTTNLAVGGGTPIEAFTAVSRALRCPVPPLRVVISLDAGHFMQPDLFWERTVRFGFLDAAELAALERAAESTGDAAAFNSRRSDGLPDRLRGTLYAARFPPLYFSSLLKGGGILRWWRNTANFEDGLASRGHYYFGTDPGSSTVAVDAHLRRFHPMPVLDHYFDRMLALLADRGIPADFISMPMNQATWRQVRPDFHAAFANYLAGYAERYPGFRMVGPVMPHWPDRYFGDGFSHLNPAGAARFSSILGHCIAARFAAAADPESCQSEAFLMAGEDPR